MQWKLQAQLMPHRPCSSSSSTSSSFVLFNSMMAECQELSERRRRRSRRNAIEWPMTGKRLSYNWSNAHTHTLGCDHRLCPCSSFEFDCECEQKMRRWVKVCARLLLGWPKMASVEKIESKVGNRSIGLKSSFLRMLKEICKSYLSCVWWRSKGRKKCD